MKRLTGPEIGVVANAMSKAFINIMELQNLILSRIDKDISRFINMGAFANMNNQCFEVIREANAKMWHYELINALLAEIDSAELEKLAYDLGISHSIYTEITDESSGLDHLEKLVNQSEFQSVSILIHELSLIERAVCRIEVIYEGKAKALGTGFLIKPDLVLTNYHVIEEFLHLPHLLQCRFDYRENPDRVTIYEGNTYKLSETKSIVATSNCSPLDNNPPANLDDAEWAENELDYSAIRLETKVGSLPFGPVKTDQLNNSPTRGYLQPPEQAPIIIGSELIIVQHPSGRPVKVAFSKEGILEANDKRIRYDANTLPGSSGSPCFNTNFELIALHNSGENNHLASFNQGIPIDIIFADLKNKGVI